MFDIRTDLIIEHLEMARAQTCSETELEGVKTREYNIEGVKTTIVEILNEIGGEITGKPQGKYYTLELEHLIRREDGAFTKACTAVSNIIRDLIDINDNDMVLITGLGNRYITPDAIGPKTVDNVLVTKHLVDNVPEYFGDYRKVIAIAPGVLGITGLEAGDIVKGIMDRTPNVKAIIAIDALAARRLSRLVSTIQITDTGVIPGSGVGNSRQAFNKSNLGVKVIAIGVPTVVDGRSIAMEIEGEIGNCNLEVIQDLKQPVIVTTNEIDRQVVEISRVIGYGINLALHNNLNIADIDMLMS